MPPGCLDKPVRHFDGRHGWLQMDCNHPDMFTQFVAGTVSRCGFPHHCAWKWEQGSTRSSKTPWLFHGTKRAMSSTVSIWLTGAGLCASPRCREISQRFMSVSGRVADCLRPPPWTADGAIESCRRNPTRSFDHDTPHRSSVRRCVLSPPSRESPRWNAIRPRPWDS